MSIALSAADRTALEPDLPVLREDLELMPGPRGRNGWPTWTIYDPVRARYFRISQWAFELLSRWHLGSWPAIRDAVARANARQPTDQERDWLIRFLNVNMLVRRESPSALEAIEAVGRAATFGWLTWALHHYLFVRIPLIRPQRFLNATLPAVRAMWKPWIGWAFAGLAILGLYLALRQWDTYLATFVQFNSPAAVMGYAFAIVLAKIVHELGHAYTAAHFGCRVPTMGVAFLVLWPVLYTDTSEAWRLQSKSARLAIGAAGMLSEVALAILATLLWSFLPDGPFRSAVFIVATVTWLMTLAVNLNPFMRFDGYYLLSDLLEVENLQDRAFAHAKWWLRERLFALGEMPPEPFSAKMGRVLLVYAVATWIYRLVLFLGIALLVYAFFFKVLGIVLFVAELAWFIALPVMREFKAWWERRALFHFNRNSAVTLGMLLVAMLALVVPWSTSVSLPAVLQSQARAQVFAPMAAQVESVSIARGDPVAKGDVLVTLRVPDLAHQIEQARRRVELVRLQVHREAAGGTEAENIRVLERRLETEAAQLAGLEQQRAQLTVRAPLGGRIAELPSTLKAGVWVNAERPLALVVDDSAARLSGFVDERDVAFVAVGAQARFRPEDPMRPTLKARVTTVDDVNSPQLDIPYLGSVHGGAIAVEKTPQGALMPLAGIYRVSLTPDPPQNAPVQVVRGTVHVDGPARSFAVRAWRRVWGVLVRESGF